MPTMCSQAGSWQAVGISSAAVCCRHSLADNEGRLMLKNLTYNELEEWCVAAGAPDHGSNTPAPNLLLLLACPAAAWQRQPPQQ